MNTFFSRKILGVGIAFFVIGAGAFLLRQGVFRSFPIGGAPSPNGGSMERVIDKRSSDTPQTPESKKDQQTRTSPIPAPSPFPPYQGRPLGEARFDPDILKSLSEQEQERMQSEIKTAARDAEDNLLAVSRWLQLGLLKKNIGDYEGARDAWRYAAIVSPNFSTPFGNLAEVYRTYLKDYPAAEENYKKAIERNRRDPLLYRSLAEFYFYIYTPKRNQAIGVLEQGLKQLPHNTSLMSQIAFLYEEQGHIEKALEWWQKVLAENPKNREVASTIERLKQELGR